MITLNLIALFFILEDITKTTFIAWYIRNGYHHNECSGALNNVPFALPLERYTRDVGIPCASSLIRFTLVINGLLLGFASQKAYT